MGLLTNNEKKHTHTHTKKTKYKNKNKTKQNKTKQNKIKNLWSGGRLKRFELRCISTRNYVLQRATTLVNYIWRMEIA